jgi:glycine hydroxymethyltransferase
MHPGGVRIGVPEVTRLGMREGEMKEIANFIKRVVVDKHDPTQVSKDVEEFRKQFKTVQYAFDSAVKAYEYISLTGRT